VPYQSVDALQKTLADTVFSYATDAKKASGRALGTLVEIITFYTLRAWNLRDHIAIERPLPEFANHDTPQRRVFVAPHRLERNRAARRQAADDFRENTQGVQNIRAVWRIGGDDDDRQGERIAFSRWSAAEFVRHPRGSMGTSRLQSRSFRNRQSDRHALPLAFAPFRYFRVQARWDRRRYEEGATDNREGKAGSLRRPVGFRSTKGSA